MEEKKNWLNLSLDYDGEYTRVKCEGHLNLYGRIKTLHSVIDALARSDDERRLLISSFGLLDCLGLVKAAEEQKIDMTALWDLVYGDEEVDQNESDA